MPGVTPSPGHTGGRQCSIVCAKRYLLFFLKPQPLLGLVMRWTTTRGDSVTRRRGSSAKANRPGGETEVADHIRIEASTLKKRPMNDEERKTKWAWLRGIA